MTRARTARTRAAEVFDGLLVFARTGDPARQARRCPKCKRQGYLLELAVEINTRTSKLTYIATWVHPFEDDTDDQCEVEL